MPTSDKVSLPYTGNFATTYDTFYSSKDDEGECVFLEQLFNRFSQSKVYKIIDLGCGTGRHAVNLARRGYQVIALDRSIDMVNETKQKVQTYHLDNQIRVQQADITSFQLGETADAAICMFSVLGYQNTNEALFNTLKTTRAHLHRKGLFIFDVWYGPAVLSERPENRVKIIDSGTSRLIRIATPTMLPQVDTVIVSYQLYEISQDHLVHESTEDHPVRYFFLPEIEFFLSQAGFRLTHTCPFLDLDGEVSSKSWTIAVVAEAI